MLDSAAVGTTVSFLARLLKFNFRTTRAALKYYLIYFLMRLRHTINNANPKKEPWKIGTRSSTGIGYTVLLWNLLSRVAALRFVASIPLPCLAGVIAFLADKCLLPLPSEDIRWRTHHGELQEAE